jgi:hypothetical protein
MSLQNQGVSKMGFSSFSPNAKRLIEVVRDNVDDNEVKDVIFKDFISIFEDMDFDNMDELKGIDPVLDAILYPDDLDQEDELDDEGYEIWDEEEDDEWDEEDDDDLEY